jgi:hypothetical protein
MRKQDRVSVRVMIAGGSQVGELEREQPGECFIAVPSDEPFAGFRLEQIQETGAFSL